MPFETVELEICKDVCISRQSFILTKLAKPILMNLPKANAKMSNTWLKSLITTFAIYIITVQNYGLKFSSNKIFSMEIQLH